MPPYRRVILLCGLAVAAPHAAISAEQGPATTMTRPEQTATVRDGRHDFDDHIGTWTTQLKRLQKPLSGSTTWLAYEGTSVVHALADGRANLVELDVSGPAGRIEGLLLRLYNPASRQWSMHFANIAAGVLTPPLIGDFNGGRGEFFAQDTYGGRAILVRFVITDISPDSLRFEQSFSADGGKTWEVNWIAVDTRRQAPKQQRRD